MTRLVTGSSNGSVIEGIHLADNLEYLRSMPDACVDLIYIDPPFGTGTTRRMNRIRTGEGSSTRKGFGGRTYEYDVVSSMAYDDSMSLEDYLRFVAVRLVEMRFCASV